MLSETAVSVRVVGRSDNLAVLVEVTLASCEEARQPRVTT
jgi:hypothetical protein